MSRRILKLCLLAYPRKRRDTDGEILRDLAADLSDDHGTPREALALLRGGVAARIADRRGARARSRGLPRTVALLGVALAALAATLIAVAAINAGYVACSPGEPVSIGTATDGDVVRSCGGTDPLPYLIGGGLALAGAAAFGVAWFHRRKRPL
jgi:hypothetical protein